MSSALSKAEINTLLAMAIACETLTDAEDTLSLYSLLDESLKPQLRQALKTLPAETRMLLRSAAALSQSSEGRVAS